MASPYPANVVALPPGSSKLETFQFFVQELVVQVIVMEQSCWLYIGRHDAPTLDALNLRMMDSDSCLLGSSEEGRQIAQHVQKRFKLGACFVSFNGTPDQSMAAESAVIRELAERKLFAPKN